MLWNPFRRRDKSEEEFQEKLQDLERRAANASGAYAGQYLNQAGDMHYQAGDLRLALHFWGHAIDAFLEDARLEAAAAACRKVIHHAPEVVRARRTLALLAIGRGHVKDAILQVESYVEAAQASDRADITIPQLRLMGKTVKDSRFRRRIAELLDELGDARGSFLMKRLANASAALEEEDRLQRDPHELWSVVTEAALTPPEEMIWGL